MTERESDADAEAPIRLAVTTEPEYERLERPLRDVGVEAVHVPTEERATVLAESPHEPVDVGFVYPQRIAEGGVADAFLDVPWVNDREALLRSRHKAETLARLNRAGIATPKTALVSNPLDRSELRAVFEEFDPPVVVKPNSATRGAGVVRVDDYDSAAGVVDYLDLLHENKAIGDQSYLVQEFVPDARDYRVMVVDGEYAGAVERRLPTEDGGWKHNVHRGAEATGATPPPELRRLAEDAAAALGIGWVGVDLLVSERRAVVNETNARPTVDDATKYEADFWERVAALIRKTAAESEGDGTA